MRAPIEMQLASLWRRPSSAVITSQQRAQRTPGTRLATIASPLPEPPSTMPRSTVAAGNGQRDWPNEEGIIDRPLGIGAEVMDLWPALVK